MTRLFAVFAILLITVAAVSLQAAMTDAAREAALYASASDRIETPGGTIAQAAYVSARKPL